MKNKTSAAILALFLGGLGVHKFYLGRTVQGLLYLFLCWTFIPAIIAFFEAILLLVMDEQSFNLKYNGGTSASVTVIGSPARSANVGPAAQVVDVAAQIKALHDLKLAGALSEDEFNAQKVKLLASK